MGSYVRSLYLLATKYYMYFYVEIYKYKFITISQPESINLNINFKFRLLSSRQRTTLQRLIQYQFIILIRKIIERLSSLLLDLRVMIMMSGYDQSSYLLGRKLRFINGSSDNPTEKTSLKDWFTIHSMHLQWIMHIIDIFVKLPISYYNDAKLERFSVINGPRIQQIQSTISN